VFAWPATGALYVAKSTRLGPLALPLTVAVLVLGGTLWLPILAHENPARTLEAADSDLLWASPPTVGAGSTAYVGEDPDQGEPPEFDLATLDVEIVECVQTRSVSTVRDRTIRQPRIVVEVTNRGPARTVVLHGEVMLADYGWNGGWKPTAAVSHEVAHGQTIQATLLTDYRHQSGYTPDGLHVCRVSEIELIAPQVWPEHPARQSPVDDVRAVATPERDFDPQRDLMRTDAR
jgi:hypothetical protein